MSEEKRERRRHVVFVTRNTEYHCRDRECVGVRNRQNGGWQLDHPALRGRLLGGILNGKATRRVPREGYRLVFGKQEMVMTSQVIHCGRPDREAIFSYTSLCRAGEIVLQRSSDLIEAKVGCA